MLDFASGLFRLLCVLPIDRQWRVVLGMIPRAYAVGCGPRERWIIQDQCDVRRTAILQRKAGLKQLETTKRRVGTEKFHRSFRTLADFMASRRQKRAILLCYALSCVMSQKTRRRFSGRLRHHFKKKQGRSHRSIGMTQCIPSKI